MLRDRLYYQVKPYVPWRWRMALRRLLARRSRRRSQAVWPINEKAGASPTGWSGWPDRKKFAFVLTHDVEGPRGLAKCRQLMQLESALGFRSSFNLVPEGEYQVPPELRSELAQNGFEVGVHDLHHDGKLYRNRDDFRQKAARVNHYLKEWGAVGFRSGFMLRNLEWFHDIEALYDASTFDTDPFEPQPEGAGTIFPFWVPGVTGSGYVELPYTLPQDSTLFLVLRETSPAIWFKKLDWIAERGGMALLDSHPDYMALKGVPAAGDEFPIEWYESFLKYVADRYAGQYWHALPRTVASFWRDNMVDLSSTSEGRL